nr:unnamed protein product [Spirometra erinaceieuropaei]
MPLCSRSRKTEYSGSIFLAVNALIFFVILPLGSCHSSLPTSDGRVRNSSDNLTRGRSIQHPQFSWNESTADAQRAARLFYLKKPIGSYWDRRNFVVFEPERTLEEIYPNDPYLDPCKADGFMGDAALTDSEVESMVARYGQVQSRPLQQWSEHTGPKSGQSNDHSGPSAVSGETRTRRSSSSANPVQENSRGLRKANSEASRSSTQASEGAYTLTGRQSRPRSPRNRRRGGRVRSRPAVSNPNRGRAFNDQPRTERRMDHSRRTSDGLRRWRHNRLRKRQKNQTRPQRLANTDMRPTRSLPDSGADEEPKRRSRRAATAYKSRTWPYGVIPYIIQANFSSETKATIMKAMRHWENHTCLSFVEREPHHKSYIIFTVKACGCCSYVGRRSEDEPQAISIGKNCDKKGIVIHELGHVIGFWHEHTRPDRDDHVEILLENVVEGQDFNFKKMDSGEVNSLREPYDYSSVMHYAKGTFAKPNKDETIRPKACCPRPLIGQRIQLSPGDVRQTNKLYGCPTICGGEVVQEEGIITSPSYPEFYKPNKECIWKIVVPVGFSVALTFQSFDIEKHDNCVYDYLEIRDGLSETSPLLKKLCGSNLPTPIKSTNNMMYVRFVSDSSVEKQGFTAKFQKEFDECKTTKHGCQHICVNTLGGYRCQCEIGYELHPDGKRCEDACGGVINAANGTVQTPGYPSEYPPNKNCIWKIVAAPKSTIFLNFTHFDLEGKNFGDLDYPVNQQCFWTINASLKNYTILLRFSFFEIEEETLCTYDYVKLFDGPDGSSQRLGEYCGRKLPPDTYADSGSLHVQFYTDDTISGKGFHAQYMLVPYNSAEHQTRINTLAKGTDMVGVHRLSPQSRPIEMIQQYHQPVYNRRHVATSTHAKMAEASTPMTYDNKISRSAFASSSWKYSAGGHRSPYYGNGLVSSAHSSFSPSRLSLSQRPMQYGGHVVGQGSSWNSGRTADSRPFQHYNYQHDRRMPPAYGHFRRRSNTAQIRTSQQQSLRHQSSVFVPTQLSGSEKSISSTYGADGRGENRHTSWTGSVGSPSLLMRNYYQQQYPQLRPDTEYGIHEVDGGTGHYVPPLVRRQDSPERKVQNYAAGWP